MEQSTTPNPYEREFAEWAASEGWTVTKRGWPDFMCRRGPELMAVEVKGPKDHVSTYQRATLRDLTDLGLPTFVWSPARGLERFVGRGRRAGPPKAELAAELVATRALLEQAVADRDRFRQRAELAEARANDIHVARSEQQGRDLRWLTEIIKGVRQVEWRRVNLIFRENHRYRTADYRDLEAQAAERRAKAA